MISSIYGQVPTNSILPNRLSQYGRHLPPTVAYPRIAPQATVRNSFVLGDVIVSPYAHVVNAALRADEGGPFYIGPYSNIQDGVVIHAHYTQKDGQKVIKNMVHVPGLGYFSVYIGNNSSLAHQVAVHGPSCIGDNTFIGFKSTIQKSKIGNNVEIGAHSYIENVIIPDNIAIAPGAIITKQEDIAQFKIPHKGLNRGIAQINAEMALAYNSTFSS